MRIHLQFLFGPLPFVPVLTLAVDFGSRRHPRKSSSRSRSSRSPTLRRRDRRSSPGRYGPLS